MLRNPLMRLLVQRGSALNNPCISKSVCHKHNGLNFLFKPLTSPVNVIGCHGISESLKRTITTSFVAVCRPGGGVFNQNLSQLFQLATTTPIQPSRTVVRCSANKGKKKTVKAVISRFYRLSNGMWIRRYAGYKKKLFKKSLNRKKRIKNHIFCNRTQSKMLDSMVTRYWRERKYYVDHPYDKYQDRNFNGFTSWPGEKIVRENYERITKHGYKMKDV
ncbi:39S ribosomal protein L35, mitochondrial-like [Anneissia japonica]|uniref:39S ribosomal protein L35, mitochondrial-like n=1 Tax=Anneissia japonica TaxID=1529436 RepID=UPI0014256D97|nr:39S ribosomal protein L35, mitochondrial-like [Anneissia japonica]XP_033098386.1 39S ribosomal protein L35, mitochondrial-like [Anneissia japonica]